MLETGLLEKDLNVSLVSLAMMEHKVLLQICDTQTMEVDQEQTSLATSKKTFKRQVNKTDRYQVNTGFKASLKRIVINAVQKKESRKDSEKIFERVLAERKFLIDAAVVKTMKTRKTMLYRDLVNEVLSFVRFPLEIAQLNLRLQYLIRDLYIEQDNPEASAFQPQTVYKYLA